MKDRKTFIRFFTIADYEEEEIWLREQSQKGWKLVGNKPPCFYTFEKSEPDVYDTLKLPKKSVRIP